MKRNQFFRNLGIVLLLFAGMTACNKDKDTVPKPGMNNIEIGANNSKTAYPGADLHIEGEIIAPGTIAGVKVKIHPEGATGWTFEKDYTEKYAGAKNANFHEHIDIPLDAVKGKYHIHITITDKSGNIAEIESELSLIVDPNLASITGFEVIYNSTKADLHVEGDITAPNKIAEMSLEIHSNSFEKQYAITGDYVGKTQFHLHKHFSLSDVPAGHYHAHLVVKDQAGKKMEFEAHFDK